MVEWYTDRIASAINGTHTGYDLQALGETTLETFKPIKQNVKDTQTAVAGGIKVSTAQDIITAGPDLLIVGGGIATTDDPEKVAHQIKTMMPED